jgi:hypothetical protein
MAGFVVGCSNRLCSASGTASSFSPIQRRRRSDEPGYVRLGSTRLDAAILVGASALLQ